jgi:hypothetical protein
MSGDMSRPTEPIESRRYRLLLAQMREEFEERNGSDYGWKTEAAKRLGISQPFVTYLSAGEREASLESVKKASQLLRLRPEFFTDSSLKAPHYRDFIGPRDSEPGEPLPQITAYLAELEADGSPAHPDDARELLAIRVSVGAHLLTRSAVRMMHDEAAARRRAEKPAPLSKGKAAMEGFVLPAEVQAKRQVK